VIAEGYEQAMSQTRGPPRSRRADAPRQRDADPDHPGTLDAGSSYQIVLRPAPFNHVLDRSHPAMSTDRRPALERFIDAVQIALIHIPELTTGDSMERFRRAATVARAIALADNPLAGPGACDSLDRFIAAEAERAGREIPDVTDPHDQVARAAATEEAIYLVGLCVGLVLADCV
jgi:hypothetical protein